MTSVFQAHVVTTIKKLMKGIIFILEKEFIGGSGRKAYLNKNESYTARLFLTKVGDLSGGMQRLPGGS